MTPNELAEIHKACFTTPRPWSALEFAALTADTNTDLLSAEGGFALIRSVAGETELLTIAVIPEFRRRGIAAHLIRLLCNMAKSRGSEQVFLEVSAENKPAIVLYEKAGFLRTGLRPKYYKSPEGNSVDAVIMALDLTETFINWSESS